MPLLQKTLKDESSVTCKMACSAVRVRWFCVSVLVISTLSLSCFVPQVLFFVSVLLFVSLTHWFFVCVLFQHCITTICSSTLSEIGLQLVIDLFALKDCGYWLVRTELLETLAELDFR